jgi:hypothetical protein
LRKMSNTVLTESANVDTIVARWVSNPIEAASKLNNSAVLYLQRGHSSQAVERLRKSLLLLKQHFFHQNCRATSVPDGQYNISNVCIESVPINDPFDDELPYPMFRRVFAFKHVHNAFKEQEVVTAVNLYNMALINHYKALEGKSGTYHDMLSAALRLYTIATTILDTGCITSERLPGECLLRLALYTNIAAICAEKNLFSERNHAYLYCDLSLYKPGA